MAPDSAGLTPWLLKRVTGTTPCACKELGQKKGLRVGKGLLEAAWKCRKVPQILFCAPRERFPQILANHVYGRGLVCKGTGVHCCMDP